MTILVSIHSPFRMWTIPAEQVERLRRDLPAHVIVHARNEREAEQGIAEAEVVFSSHVSGAQFRAARRLRWIHSPAAGIGGMLTPELAGSPVVLTNSRGLSADTIAEHVLAVTLALFRGLPLAFRRQMQRSWAQDEVGASPGSRTIAGSRLLVVGFGSIGRAVAVRMHALGASVVALRKHVGEPETGSIAEVRSIDRLFDLLPSADVVVVAAPHTRETRGLIGGPAIGRMKADAVLVNVSRGGLVDEDALASALREGRLGGAALDVFRREPLAADDPLWAVPNLLITPHTAGFRRDHWDAATALFRDNLRRFELGEPLLNVVDKAAGY